MNHYVQSLIEACYATITPVFTEITAFAMHAFGGYDMGATTAAAAVGTALGGLFMWLLGRLCSRSFERAKPERFAHLSAWANKNGLWALLFIWLPVGFALAFAAGLFRVPLRASLSLFVIGSVFFYGSVLMF